MKPQSDRGAGEVVYRRVRAEEPETGPRQTRGPEKPRRGPTEGGLAPSLRPLLVGFTLLILLVSLLGYLSERQLEMVESGVADLQQQHTGRFRFVFDLSVASYNLDNEARIRAEAKKRRELLPPFEGRLRAARKLVTELMPKLERPPFSEMPKWRKLHEDLVQYIETTKDLDTYNQDGFAQFRGIREELKDLQEELLREQDEVSGQGDELRRLATHKVRLLWLSALAIGLIVVVATIAEVQRRFRQMHQSMEEARRERHFSTQMLEGMVSAVAAIDAQERVRSANAAFFEIFPEAAVGYSVHNKLAPPELQKMLEAAVASPVDHAAYRGRWTLDAAKPPAGSRTFDVYASPLEIDGEQGQIITLVDVTEAVKAESILRRTEALAAVGQASAQVAHEIKNPLGSIRLGVSMLRDMTTDHEATRTIDLVERGIDHLNKLVVDVTQFSRQKPLTRTEVDLHRLLESSLDLVANKIQESRVPIEKNFSRQAIRGYWDEDQLRQVFINLVANAMDASETGTPVTISTERITVEAGGRASQGNGYRQGGQQHFAQITVTDHGSGMDEATRTRIFEPFFTTRRRGTGLGLAIVKQIIEQHEGTIAVASAPGEGTRFTIDLPLKTRDEG